MIRSTIILSLALLGGCAPQGETRDSVPAPAAGDVARLIGVVRVVGSAPVNVQTVLQPTDGSSIRLVGPLGPELERLAGLQVAVSGRLEPSPDPIASRQLHATEYEILSADGAPVVMGEILTIDRGWARLRTESGDEIVLSGVPATLRVGQKVWVQGPQSLAVQSFGVIRP